MAGTCSTTATGTYYWKQGDGGTIAETDLHGNWTTAYGIIRGKIASRVDLPANTLHYYFNDHLGTTSVVTSAAGVVQKESDYFPYGGEIAIVSGDTNRYKFTGKERDAESSLDYFGARYYASSVGRFVSVDPTILSGQRMVDPQQWNMFSYGRNNPTIMIDPDGREVKIATQELQNSFDHLMKSEKFRASVAPYQGKGNPDLVVERDKLGNDPMEPSRPNLGITHNMIALSIKDMKSDTDFRIIPAKLHDSTIKIDVSVRSGKGEDELDGVLAHEISHANKGATDPQGYLDEVDHEKEKRHDDRTQEQRAKQFSKDVRKEVKQEEKQEKREKKENAD
jgi:RHS repeat-associated protein